MQVGIDCVDTYMKTGKIREFLLGEQGLVGGLSLQWVLSSAGGQPSFL